MYSFVKTGMFLSAAALAGCASGIEETSRLDVSLIGFSEQRGPSTAPAEIGETINVTTEADALSALAQTLVRRSQARHGVTSAAQTDGRNKLVSADALVRNLRAMNDQMDSVEAAVHTHNARLKNLDMERDLGLISEADYAAQADSIRQSQNRIAAALSDTISNTETVQTNLQDASDRGHSGLHWHMSATAQLTREAQAARDAILRR
ncbi:hypothetical protein [uncultured Tateyamaria sp.]|uniref:hypothetical protein n=1 Tax=uncultured Tateyamaria sp. TaxID=455651 RepID=UPI0026373BDF|nr:hypothetical protein [uncultured Tateyamaria sp.]